MRLVARYAPPVVLMGVVWSFSAQPDLSSGLGGWDLVLRKGAHMVEFGLLWLLWLRAFRWHAPVVAATIALGWAAIDEVHQTTVEGRHGTPVDVLVDAAGIALAWLAWRWRGARRPG